MTSPQWRGVVEEYRPLLDIPQDTVAVTLGEGGTPLVRSDWLSGLARADVWLKVEGDNPTGSFKDRGMTTAISVAVREGARAVVCASTGSRWKSGASPSLSTISNAAVFWPWSRTGLTELTSETG